jgi:predicted nuclease of restriction endonuclease-like RecB superfamily
MLPPELTRTRKRQGKLSLAPLSPSEKQRAHAIAEELLGITRGLIGGERDELSAAWASVSVGAKERKLLLGLSHLVEQRCEFTAPASADPEVVRRRVFERASKARGELAADQRFEREHVLSEVAAELGLSVAELERSLYADLRGVQQLESCAVPSASALVSDYELAQLQSVLLRAMRLEAEVRAARPDAYRELFRKLKFRQLLFRIEPLSGGGYRLEIDGPLSLFGPTTKYGLELALSLPSLLSCGHVKLRAELRWGKRREPLLFEETFSPQSTGNEDSGVRTEVLELVHLLQQHREFKVRPCERLLDLTAEGGGVLVPDLELTRAAEPATGRSVLVELLGFWSRDAVFRRIEAAERGLAEPVLFVLSSRLRVSEQLLDDAESGKLYVYKGRINAHALLRKAEALL